MECPKNKGHYCSLCDYKCALKSRLEDHVRTHTGEKPWSCEKCERTFATQTNLLKHDRCMHQQRKKVYKCSLCSFVTHWRSSLEDHTRTHTGERVYQCQQGNCAFAAKSYAQLELQNIYKHTSERKFSCVFPNCDYRGKTKGTVSSHGNNVHNESRPFVCDFQGCSYRAKVKAALKTHKRGIHGGGYKPFSCSMCNYCTSHKFRLNQHELTHTEKSVKCHFSECTFTCNTKRNLQSHVKNRHSERILKCDFAGCLFTTTVQRRFKGHQKKVHCEKAHKCTYCDYRAHLPSQVQVHVGRYHTSQLVSCPYTSCTFQTKSRESLNVHIKGHKAKLGCPLEGCDYAASSKSAWERHMQLHDPTGRPFPCPLCPKHFLRKHQFSQHLRRHTQEKPFKCPACNFSAESKDKFTTHMRAIHSRAFPNFVFDERAACDHCHLNFGCAVGLAMHTITLKTVVVVLTRLPV